MVYRRKDYVLVIYFHTKNTLIIQQDIRFELFYNNKEKFFVRIIIMEFIRKTFKYLSLINKTNTLKSLQ